MGIINDGNELISVVFELKSQIKKLIITNSNKIIVVRFAENGMFGIIPTCLLYTSDAADEL